MPGSLWRSLAYCSGGGSCTANIVATALCLTYLAYHKYLVAREREGDGEGICCVM